MSCWVNCFLWNRSTYTVILGFCRFFPWTMCLGFCKYTRLISLHFSESKGATHTFFCSVFLVVCASPHESKQRMLFLSFLVLFLWIINAPIQESFQSQQPFEMQKEMIQKYALRWLKSILEESSYCSTLHFLFSIKSCVWCVRALDPSSRRLF